MVRKIIAIYLITANLCGCAYYATAKISPRPDFSYSDWKVLNDSGWPANSNGYVEKLKSNDRGVKLNYSLKATKLWPWPEIDFFVEFKRPRDLRRYKGVQLKVKGKKKEEIYFFLLIKDANIKKLKPCWNRFMSTPNVQEIYLPFSRFKIAKDWIPRNPGFNPSIEWDKVEALGFHKKGRSGDKGAIYLFDIKFLQKEPQERLDLERIRSLSPEHFFINLRNYSLKREKKADIKITINNSISLQKNKIISPYLYGANWGVWLDFPDKKKVASLGLKLIRAGGPFMDRYNWRSKGYTFPGNKRNILMRSLDDFIQYCRQIGAEPLIQINALGYAPDEQNKDRLTSCMGPEDAADLVRYLNEEKGYNVRFFEIGNEPFIWHRVHFDVRETPCSIEEYFEIFKEISLAMKKAQNEIDPEMQLEIFGPAISTSYLSWETLSLETDSRLAIEYFLQECHNFEKNSSENPEGFRILDVLSFHFFPSFKDPRTGRIQEDISSILESTQVWWSQDYANKYDRSVPLGAVAKVIPRFKTWIEDNYPGTELAITEFNIDSQSMVDYNPAIKVLYLADLYGIMAKYGVNYATQFCLNSSDHNIALIDDVDNITPLYYPLALYAKYFKGTILDVETSLPEKLNVYACNNEGDTIIMVINKEKKSYFTEVILQEEENKDSISFFYNFPALSLTCIKTPINKEDNLIECWEYGDRQINGTIDNNSNL